MDDTKEAVVETALVPVKAESGTVYLGDGDTLPVAAPHGLLTIDQINLLSRKTPQKYIKKRKGRGGKEFSYVEVGYVTGVLNAIFGYSWDFEIVEKDVNLDAGQIAILGRLTVRMANGQVVRKEAWGGSDIKMLKEGGMVDFPDDLKAASSDSLKKAASMLGVAWDVYAGLSVKEDERYGEGKAWGAGAGKNNPSKPPQPAQDGRRAPVTPTPYVPPSRPATPSGPAHTHASPLPVSPSDPYPQDWDDPDAFLQDAGTEAEDKAKFATIVLTQATGSRVKVDKFQALKMFGNIRAAIGDENYYRILTSFKVNHANEIKPAKLPEVYAALVEAYHTLQQYKNLTGGK